MKYPVAYGLRAFLAPKDKSAVARSTRSFHITFKLAGLGASLAGKLAKAGGVRVTLSGPGIAPVTVRRRDFQISGKGIGGKNG